MLGIDQRKCREDGDCRIVPKWKEPARPSGSEEFRFEGEELSITHSEGEAVILEPLRPRTWPKGYWRRWGKASLDLDLVGTTAHVADLSSSNSHEVHPRHEPRSCISLKLQGRVVEQMREHLPERDRDHDRHARGALVRCAQERAQFGGAAGGRRLPRAIRACFLSIGKQPAPLRASRFDLERIGPHQRYSLLIASIALARNLTVVTHNLGSHPSPALKTEDWH